VTAKILLLFLFFWSFSLPSFHTKIPSITIEDHFSGDLALSHCVALLSHQRIISLYRFKSTFPLLFSVFFPAQMPLAVADWRPRSVNTSQRFSGLKKNRAKRTVERWGDC
jgi:hypothetical protein